MTRTKVLVTGGAGFIGSHIVDALLKRDCEVWSLDDYSAGTDDNLELARGFDTFHCVEGCVEELDTLALLPDDIEFVFHEAARKKNAGMGPFEDLVVNVGGTLNLLLWAEAHDVKRFIHASSGSVYGECDRHVDEMSVCLPVSAYGVSKLAGERYVSMFDKTGRVPGVILRYFHVYGPRQCSDPETGGVIAIWSDRLARGLKPVLHGDGRQVRYFTHVSDVVAANMKAMTDDAMLGRVFNVNNPEAHSLHSVAEMMCDIYGRPRDYEQAPPLPGDIRRFDVSSDALRNLGFTFEVKLFNGLFDMSRR